MILLLDTQILLWLSVDPERLSEMARNLIEDRSNTLYFSPISLIEIAIKRSKGGLPQVDLQVLESEWVVHEFLELPVSSKHAVVMDDLPPLHKDPFDRILLSQAIAEDMLLLTTDGALVRYGTSVLDAR